MAIGRATRGKNPAQHEAMRFEISLGEWTENVLPEYINEAKKVIALEALTGIVMKNPVDTSRSQSNWNVTIDKPSEDADYKRFDNNPAGVIARGEADMSRARPGDDIWISNNIHYIVFLEHGTPGGSDQAPNGFVGLTLEELRLHYA